MSWEDIEDAMQKAITTASGFPSTQVVWSYQDINEPTLPHIIINFGGGLTLGIDRVATTQDLNRPNGEEIKQEIRGVREVPFNITCFTSDVLGSDAARHVLEVTRTKLRLPDIRYPLRKAGITPFDPGPVQYVPDIPSARFRGRANCMIRCYVPVQDCFEYTGYIARVMGVVYPTGFGASHGTSGIAFDSG